MEMENCVTKNKKSDAEIPHENYMETIEDAKGNKQLKSDKLDEICLITERICAEDDELWNIDDTSDSDGDTIGNGIKVFSSFSDIIKEKNSTKLQPERKMLATTKKSSNVCSDTFKTSPIVKECMEQEMETESNILAEKNKDLQYSKDTPIETNFTPYSEEFMEDLPRMREITSKVFAPIKPLLKQSNFSSDSDSETFLNYKEIAKQEIIKHRLIEKELMKQEINKESKFSAKKKKRLQDTEEVTCKKVKNKVNQNSVDSELSMLILENKVRSELGEENIFDKTENDHRPLENDDTSVECFGQPDPRSYWTHLPHNSTDISNTSCSTSLSESSKLSCSYNSSTSVDENSVLSDNLETKYLLNFYNKVFLNDLSSLKEMSEESIEVSPLEECVLEKELSKRISSDNRDVDSDSDFNNFVEDPDIVNPDILHNINLHEYYMQMELLVQKISETPDDQTVLAECLQLLPIPESEHEPKTFTAEDRYNFANGISECEYDIDSEDWNKIMVKRAVVFTAHAGFNIANEESLYVLADVAIDYIKNLAVVMKNNFDIEENSCYPDSIDPINNSLLQVGVKGGIAELIRFYDHDVFGRRDKLIKKCQHLQKIIDQYTERMLAINTKTQHSFKDEFVRENPTSEKIIVKEETKLKEEKTEMRTLIEEAQTDILSTIEEFEIETQSTSVGNVFANIKIEQSEPVCLNNTNCKIKIETNETLKYEPVDRRDIKIEYDGTNNLKSMDGDISKHFVIEPDITDITLLKDVCAKDLTSLGTTDLEYPLLKCSNSSSSTQKNKKLLDFATVKKWLEQFYPNEVEPKSEVDPAEEARVVRKRLQEHSTEFAALLKRYASYNNSLSTDSNVNLAVNKLTNPQTVIVNQKSDENEASSLNKNSTIQNIPTPVGIDLKDYYDYKMLC